MTSLPPYRLFLMDLDDTLFDFKRAEKQSILAMMGKLGITGDLTALTPIYSAINERLWADFAAGTVTKEFLNTERFRLFFEKHGWDHCPTKAAEIYLDELGSTSFLVPDALEVCRELKKTAKLGIVTNGIHRVQSRKLKNSGLDRIIDFVICSEQCGFQKPDPRFFAHALEKAGHSSKDDVLVVGDKIDVDIKGAHQSGLFSCWYNPEGSPNPVDYSPHHEIKSLKELCHLRR